jgi:hypothetical protein
MANSRSAKPRNFQQEGSKGSEGGKGAGGKLVVTFRRWSSNMMRGL